jgi:2-C-methyl-D-erythritol 4-phosphate cytidylyltransferase
MKSAAVVVAAGSGTRFGAQKQFLLVDGETIAARSVAAARAACDLVILVVPRGYDGAGEGADVIVTGGDTRAASVRCGLAKCEDVELVIVHDAARPNATPELFRAVLTALNAGADAVIPGLPVADTIKRVRVAQGATVVAETLAREELVAVQTPQGFRRAVLEKAHASSADATDDAGLVEASGGVVVVIPGEATNIKITHARDLDALATRSQP